ncbi:MAG: hypothetical protein VX764_02860 [Planctomycetota bacterium]|nr:hypothetical protein [Planctomycetota bacterium]
MNTEIPAATEPQQSIRARPRQRSGVLALVSAMIASLFCLPLAILPGNVACFYARALARPAWLIAGRRRRVTLSNLRHAYGSSWSEEKIRRVGLESWRRVAMSAVEALQIGRWLRDPEFRKRIVWSGPWQQLEERHRAGEAFLLVSGHLGPFEVILPTLVERGWHTGLLSRPIKNLYIHRLLNWIRRGTIPKILDPAGALPEMGRALGEGTSIALLVDQNDRSGVFVPFLGRPAGTTPSIGVLTRRYRVPVIYLTARRIEAGRRYRLTCELADLPRGADIRGHLDLVTRSVSDRIEKMVREVPADWLWMHQRWKARPDGSRENLL